MKRDIEKISQRTRLFLRACAVLGIFNTEEQGRQEQASTPTVTHPVEDDPQAKERKNHEETQ